MGRWNRSPGEPLFLIGLVILSGAASLMYQVAWTRRLASVTSVTETAQAVILAVFLSGLALGAYLAGRRAPRLDRPLLGYAWVEVGAALLAAVSISGIGASDAIRTGLAWIGVPLGVGLWIQLAVCALFLMVPASLLGASLPLLIEHVQRLTDPGPKGSAATARLAGVLYGFNTLGAASGSLLAGFVTIEAFGLSRTCWLGGGVAAVAAALAVLRSRRLGDAGSEVRPPAPRSRRGTAAAKVAVAQAVSETFAPPPAVSLYLAVALAGAVGLGAEIMWTRLLSLVVRNTVYAFSQVLAGVLIGIGVGALLASAVIRYADRGPDPRSVLLRIAALLQALSAVFMALTPLAIVQLAGMRDLQLALASGFSPAGSAVLLGLLVPPAALTASALPLLVAALKREGSSSRTFGDLYAANTVGSVAGSLVAGFLLLPYLGSGYGFGVLQLGAAGVALLLLGRSSSAAYRWAVPAAAALVVVSLQLLVDIPRAIYDARLDENLEILELRQGIHSDVMVTQETAGRFQGRRRIWINSSWVAGTGGGHRSLGHLPALFVEEPRRVLGIALGTGQTFASVLQHGEIEFHCVELNEGVLELARRWFGEANRGLLERPGVHVHRDDGRAFLRSTSQRFDIIVLEPLQAWSAGTSNLYSREFYEEARRVLAPGGIVAQWLPLYGQGPRETRAVVRAALEEFPEASFWLDGHDGILLLGDQPFKISLGVLRQRIRSRGIATELGRGWEYRTEDLLAMFLMGPRGLKRWGEGAPLLTDDHPFLEFAAARDLSVNRYAEVLASLTLHLESPQDYSIDSSPEVAQIGRVATGVRAALFRERSVPAGDFAARASALENAIADAPYSVLLQRRYSALIMEWAITPPPGQPDTIAFRAWVYRRGLMHGPALGEAAYNLALLYAKQRRFDEARQALSLALRVERVRDSALALQRRIEDDVRSSTGAGAEGKQCHAGRGVRAE